MGARPLGSARGGSGRDGRALAHAASRSRAQPTGGGRRGPQRRARGGQPGAARGVLHGFADRRAQPTLLLDGHRGRRQPHAAGSCHASAEPSAQLRPDLLHRRHRSLQGRQRRVRTRPGRPGPRRGRPASDAGRPRLGPADPLGRGRVPAHLPGCGSGAGRRSRRPHHVLGRLGPVRAGRRPFGAPDLLGRVGAASRGSPTPRASSPSTRS